MGQRSTPAFGSQFFIGFIFRLPRHSRNGKRKLASTRCSPKKVIDRAPDL
jgi:hypothetical protein